MPPQARIFRSFRPGVDRNRRGFYIDGLTQARKNIAALPEAFREVMAEEFQVGGRIILGEAAARAPVGFRALQPGHVRLKPSLGMTTSDDGLQVAVGSGDFTAPWVEFGTNDTRAQPFLFPAFRLGMRYVRRQMRSWAKKAGEKVRLGTKGTTKRGIAAAKALRAAK